jgi:hypothetical protein
MPSTISWSAFEEVDGQHVAFARLGLLALDELRALLVGGRRELDQLGRDLGEPLVERLGGGGEVAGRVLAHAERDVALGAVHRADVHDLRAPGLAARRGSCPNAVESNSPALPSCA